jgi:hypothetical protein
MEAGFSVAGVVAVGIALVTGGGELVVAEFVQPIGASPINPTRRLVVKREADDRACF